MIEPAGYGAAVSFGPKTRNFRDVVSQMLAADAGVVVRDQVEMTAFVQQCLEAPDFRRDLGERAQALVHQNVGATAKTVDLLKPMLMQQSDSDNRLRQAG